MRVKLHGSCKSTIKLDFYFFIKCECTFNCHLSYAILFFRYVCLAWWVFPWLFNMVNCNLGWIPAFGLADQRSFNWQHLTNLEDKNNARKLKFSWVRCNLNPMRKDSNWESHIERLNRRMLNANTIGMDTKNNAKDCSRFEKRLPFFFIVSKYVSMVIYGEDLTWYVFGGEIQNHFRSSTSFRVSHA